MGQVGLLVAVEEATGTDKGEDSDNTAHFGNVGELDHDGVPRSWCGVLFYMLGPRFKDSRTHQNKA
jgi:hypothetical protein